MMNNLISKLNGLTYPILDYKSLGRLAKDNGIQALNPSEQALAFAFDVSQVLSLNPSTPGQILDYRIQDGEGKEILVGNQIQLLSGTDLQMRDLLLSLDASRITDNILGNVRDLRLKITSNSVCDQIELIVNQGTPIDITDYKNQ